MSLALDPNQTVEFSLTSDAGEPDATRPVFVVRVLTARQTAAYRKLLDAALALEREDRTDESLDKCAEAAAIILVGGRNVRGGAPEAARLPDTLSYGDLWEFLFGALAAGRPTVEERKNSASPSPSDAAASAETVTAPASA